MSLPSAETAPNTTILQRPELENQARAESIHQKAAEALGQPNPLPVPISENHERIQLKSMQPAEAEQPKPQTFKRSPIERAMNWVKTEFFNKPGNAPSHEGLHANLERQEQKGFEVQK